MIYKAEQAAQGGAQPQPDANAEADNQADNVEDVDFEEVEEN